MEARRAGEMNQGVLACLLGSRVLDNERHRLFFIRLKCTPHLTSISPHDPYPSTRFRDLTFSFSNHLSNMDLTTQALVGLVFVLSAALYVRSGPGSSQSQPAPPPTSTKSSQKKKQKKKQASTQSTPATASIAAAVEAAPPPSISEPEVSAQEDDPTPVVPTPTSKSKSKAAKKKAKKAAAGLPSENGLVNGSNGHSADEDAGASTLTQAEQLQPRADPAAPFTPNGSFTMADFEAAEEPQEEEVWTSVGGKGAGRLNAVKNPGPAAGTVATGTSSSFASTNPFAVLPSAGGKPSPSNQGRSISIPSSSSAASSGGRNGAATGKFTPSSSSSAASSAEQTKRQRQNAARQAAAKAAKDAEEKERQARLDAHRREARISAAREEERKRATKVARTASGPPNGAGSKQPTASASVNLQGQLVWE